MFNTIKSLQTFSTDTIQYPYSIVGLPEDKNSFSVSLCWFSKSGIASLMGAMTINCVQDEKSF